MYAPNYSDNHMPGLAAKIERATKRAYTDVLSYEQHVKEQLVIVAFFAKRFSLGLPTANSGTSNR
jgi:hypothetical protein